MKKLLLITGLVLAVVTVNAQWYVGGSVVIGTNSNYNSDGKKIGISTTNFSIVPEVGYNLSPKSDIGLSVRFLRTIRDSYQAAPGELASKNTSTGWDIYPYVRHSFFSIRQF